MPSRSNREESWNAPSIRRRERVLGRLEIVEQSPARSGCRAIQNAQEAADGVAAIESAGGSLRITCPRDEQMASSGGDRLRHRLPVERPSTRPNARELPPIRRRADVPARKAVLSNGHRVTTFGRTAR